MAEDTELVAAVLRCRDLGEAKNLYPQFIQRALSFPGTPGEVAFREYWKPSTEHHHSMRTMLTKIAKELSEKDRHEVTARARAEEDTIAQQVRGAYAAASHTPIQPVGQGKAPAERRESGYDKQKNRAGMKGVPTKEMLLALARGEKSVEDVEEATVEAAGGKLQKGEFDPAIRTGDSARISGLPPELLRRQVEQEREQRKRDLGIFQRCQVQAGVGRERDRDTQVDYSQEGADVRAFCIKHDIDDVCMRELLMLPPEKQQEVIKGGKLDLSRARNKNAVMTKRVQDAYITRTQ